MTSQHVTDARLKEITGKNYAEPVAEDKTLTARAVNRRIEAYMYASAKMITYAQVKLFKSTRKLITGAFVL